MTAVIEYDDHTALVVVDVQNDFADPSGSLTVPGADDVITAVNSEIEAASAAGAMIVYTQDWHPPRTPHFVTDGGPWPIHCVRDTWGAELHPALTVKGGFVLKGTAARTATPASPCATTTASSRRPASMSCCAWPPSSAWSSSGWPSTTA